MIVAVLLVICFGVANNICGKIKAKALGEYNVYAAIINNAAYVSAYAIILTIIRGRKLMTSKEVAFFFGPNTEWSHSLLSKERNSSLQRTFWPILVVISILDVAGVMLGLVAQWQISGPMYSIMLQSIVLFSAIASRLILKTVYTNRQITAIGIVITGAVISCFAQYADGEGMPDGSGTVRGAMLAVFSTIPTAISFSLKEVLFTSYNKKYMEPLNIFVVGLFSSLIGLLLAPAILITHSVLSGSPSLNSVDAFTCMMGQNPHGESGVLCTPAPVAVAVYMGANLIFNFAMLNLVRGGSSLVCFMANKAVLPLATLSYAFLPLPLLGNSDTIVNGKTIISLAIILLGLAMFHTTAIY